MELGRWEMLMSQKGFRVRGKCRGRDNEGMGWEVGDCCWANMIYYRKWYKQVTKFIVCVFFINIRCEFLNYIFLTDVWPGNAFTTTTVIDSKNGSVPKSPGKVLKRTVTEDIVTTFSSPAAWLLVIALIITWSAVAVVMFDLVDYKNFSGKIQEVWLLN